MNGKTIFTIHVNTGMTSNTNPGQPVSQNLYLLKPEVQKRYATLAGTFKAEFNGEFKIAFTEIAP
jgi:hypothetical protein